MQNKYQAQINSLNITPNYRSENNSNNSSFIFSEKTKPDFEKIDDIILNEINSNDYGLKSNYEFDYNSPDDINKFLTKFLKTSFPVEKLTEFINKLCSNFSELLYYSYMIIKEVHQLEIVCKSINERFKYYYELNFKNERLIKKLYNEINNNPNKNIARNINNKKEISDTILEKGENINIDDMNNSQNENNYDELVKKLDLTQMNLNISNKKAELYEKKYEQIKGHFEQYKEMSKEENNSLKFKIDLLTKENDEMKKKFSDFNNFFNNLLDKDKIKEKKKELD
jgi:hypothetical protein